MRNILVMRALVVAAGTLGTGARGDAQSPCTAVSDPTKPQRLLCQQCFRPVETYAARCPMCGLDPAPKSAVGTAPKPNHAQGVAVLLVIAASLSVWFWQDSPEEEARKARDMAVFDAKVRALSVLQRVAKDPGSVETRSERVKVRGAAWLVCGEMNAKNGFGAFTGFQRFVVSSVGDVVLEESQGVAAVEALWRLCE